MAKLIFGCGYLGQRVARLWRAAGNEVFAVTRSPQRAEHLAREGVRPIVGDLATGAQIAIPQGVRTVLFAVGYDRASGQTIHEAFVGGMARALESLSEPIERFLYIGSTGVYGHVTGVDVDEDSACQPTREGGRACLAAEALLRGSRVAERTIVLRLAGLYGPERIPRGTDLRAGRPIDAPREGWLNLIHVEDAARIVLLAEQRANAPRTFVVSDGQPALRAEYYGELARLLEAPPPKFVEPSGDSAAAQRAASDKRVNPARMFAELRPELQYPSYREGLAAIVRETRSGLD